MLSAIAVPEVARLEGIDTAWFGGGGGIAEVPRVSQFSAQVCSSLVATKGSWQPAANQVAASG
jgi:hypothetical protein